MQIYLVGGAVRDQLMNKPVKDRDWVVVGGSVQAMLAQGYVAAFAWFKSTKDSRWRAPALRAAPQALFGVGPAVTGLLFFHVYQSLELATILAALAFAACLMLAILMALFDYRELRRV